MKNDYPHFKFTGVCTGSEGLYSVPWLVQNGNPIDDDGSDMLLCEGVYDQHGKPIHAHEDMDDRFNVREGDHVSVMADPFEDTWTGTLVGQVQELQPDGSFALAITDTEEWDIGPTNDVTIHCRHDDS